MLTMDTRPVPNPNVIGHIVENEAVLVLPDRGEVKVLNEVGARIWTLADGTRSVREIAAAICAEYEVERPQAEADTLDFVRQLVERGIVLAAASPPAEPRPEPASGTPPAPIDVLGEDL